MLCPQHTELARPATYLHSHTIMLHSSLAQHHPCTLASASVSRAPSVGFTHPRPCARHARHRSNAAAGSPQPADPAEPPKQQTGAEEEQPLWWVEQFEQRRKQLEVRPQPACASGGDAAAPPPQQRLAAVPWHRLALQLGQLSLVVAALILWPASLYPAGLQSGRVWWAFLVYLAFFGGGSVLRLVCHGPLASRQQDAQAKSAGSRAAQVLFIAAMPLLHWGAVGSFLKRQCAAALAQQQQMQPVHVAASDAVQRASGAVALVAAPAAPGLPALRLYDVVGFVMMAAAVALNWAAARRLGRSYDRVRAPDALVTSGPYRFVQHPIYSSYMLLFVGYAMWMHAWPAAVGFLAACLLYYRSRTRLEAAGLQAAFGQAHAEYAARTKLFVPFLL